MSDKELHETSGASETPQNDSWVGKTWRLYDTARNIWVEFKPADYTHLGDEIEGSKYWDYFVRDGNAVVIKTIEPDFETIESIPLETAIQNLCEARQPIPKEFQHLVDFAPDDSNEIDLLIGVLGDYDKQFLIAMRKLKAISPESKRTISKIVYQISRNADPNSGYKKCSPKLQKTTPPLIVKCGNKGLYLSNAGTVAAERLDAVITS